MARRSAWAAASTSWSACEPVVSSRSGRQARTIAVAAAAVLAAALPLFLCGCSEVQAFARRWWPGRGPSGESTAAVQPALPSDLALLERLELGEKSVLLLEGTVPVRGIAALPGNAQFALYGRYVIRKYLPSEAPQPGGSLRIVGTEAVYDLMEVWLAPEPLALPPEAAAGTCRIVGASRVQELSVGDRTVYVAGFAHYQLCAALPEDTADHCQLLAVLAERVAFFFDHAGGLLADFSFPSRLEPAGR